MNYTIISTTDFQFNQVIDIVKDGNTYNINFTNSDKFITKKFRTLEEAQEMYKKIIYCFINGYYTFEQRANFIVTGHLCI